MDYAKQVAETALQACSIAAGAKGLYGLESLIDLDAIIASVPRPEPVATVDMYPNGTKSISWRESNLRGLVGGTPLYAAPVSAESVDARLLDALTGLLEDITDLVADSDGVAGLHLNGDIAPWDELLPSGQFERLSHVELAQEAIASAAEQAKPDTTPTPTNPDFFVAFTEDWDHFKGLGREWKQRFWRQLLEAARGWKP